MFLFDSWIFVFNCVRQLALQHNSHGSSLIGYVRSRPEWFEVSIAPLWARKTARTATTSTAARMKAYGGSGERVGRARSLVIDYLFRGDVCRGPSRRALFLNDPSAKC